jgi:hypothetical protein
VLGMPPAFMIERGRKAPRFFVEAFEDMPTGERRKTYRLKRESTLPRVRPPLPLSWRCRAECGCVFRVCSARWTRSWARTRAGPRAGAAARRGTVPTTTAAWCRCCRACSRYALPSPAPLSLPLTVLPAVRPGQAHHAVRGAAARVLPGPCAAAGRHSGARRGAHGGRRLGRRSRRSRRWTRGRTARCRARCIQHTAAARPVVLRRGVALR